MRCQDQYATFLTHWSEIVHMPNIIVIQMKGHKSKGWLDEFLPAWDLHNMLSNCGKFLRINSLPSNSTQTVAAKVVIL